MSGKDFAKVLVSTGYPDAEALLGGTDVDWMFDNPNVAPFLEWICENVSEANTVSSHELEQYEHLESEEGVLEGPLLEKALEATTTQSTAPSDKHNLQESVRTLEKELSLAQQKKDTLNRQHRQLDFHLTSLTDRLCKIDRVDKEAKAEYKQAVQQVHTECGTKTKAVQDLLVSIHDLSSIYPETTSGDESQIPMCLSQVDIDHYHSMEEKFTQELTLFTRKLFFDGIAKIAGEVDGEKYKFLEVENPDSLLVTGEREEVVLEDCKDLARLQACYERSRLDEIHAKMKEASYSAVCNFMDEKLEHLKEKPYPPKLSSLTELVQAAQSDNVQLQKEISWLTDTQIPRLIKDSASLQTTKILHGDYNLKIARQDYFSSNQNQVIEQLIVQRSRNELLTMAYEVERRNLRTVNHLLTAAVMLLKKDCNSSKARKSMMQGSVLTPSRHQRNTIDSRDKGLTRLYQMLNDDDMDRQQLFISFDQLQKDAKSVQDRFRSSTLSISTTNDSQDQRLRLIEHDLSRCEYVLYGDGGSQNSQAVLSPHQITYTLSQLNAMLKKLEQAVLDIVKEMEQKKKSLKMDPLLAKERKLFVYMFTNADHLRRAVADIQARVQAQMAS